VKLGLLICLLITCGLLHSADVPLGEKTRGAKQLAEKQIPLKEFNATQFQRSPTASEPFMKTFPTKEFNGFNSTAQLGGRPIDAPTLNFQKTFPTGNSTLSNKTFLTPDQSSVWQRPSLLFSDQKNATGFDKKVAAKEYQGRYAEAMKQDMRKITDQLGSISQMPDRTMTIEEVKELLNRDLAPKSTSSLRAPDSGMIELPESALPSVTPAP
jgi:hypothetical protein